MISSANMARFLILMAEESDALINLKRLQSLIYVANGIHLINHDTPMLEEEFVADTFGPTIPSIEAHYTAWENRPLRSRPYRTIGTDLETAQSVRIAWLKAAELPGDQFFDLVCREGSPWARLYVPGERVVIPHSDSKAYLLERFFPNVDLSKFDAKISLGIKKPRHS